LIGPRILLYGPDIVFYLGLLTRCALYAYAA
jgi:hypothetical protein